MLSIEAQWCSFPYCSLALSFSEYHGVTQLKLSCVMLPQALDLLFSRMIHQQSLAHCLTNSMRFSCQFFTIPGNIRRVGTAQLILWDKYLLINHICTWYKTNGLISFMDKDTKSFIFTNMLKGNTIWPSGVHMFTNNLM